MQMNATDNAGSETAETKKIEVFISHRKKDQAIALYLKQTLSFWSQGKIEVHVCEEILVGEEWRNWIDKRISRSNILIFLYTSETADWSWCLYEIGLFRNPKMPTDGRLMCIKNPDIEELPTPIEQFQAYNSTQDDIKQLFSDLLLEGHFTNGVKFIDKIPEAMLEPFDIAVRSLASMFELSRIERKFYAKRISIKFGETNKQQGAICLEDAYVSGDAGIMKILQSSDTKIYWKDFYANLNKDGEKPWLDELNKSLEKILASGSPKEVMTPFNTSEGWFIPVLSRVEKVRSAEPGHPAIPKRLCVIFIPMETSSFICEPFSGDMPHPKDILDVWSTYIPCSVVRLRWKKKSDELEYKIEDLEQEPVVYGINPAFARLYNFNFNDFPHPDGKKPLTSARIMERLSKYMDPLHLEKLKADQAEVGRKIIFEGIETDAAVPLQFNENHPYYPNSAFLPCLVCKNVDGEESGPHEVYLLVTYIHNFWPIDHPNNPYYEDK